MRRFVRFENLTTIKSVDGSYLAPGFIDLQVNGFAGIDFNNPEATLGEIGRALEAIVATGVTRCLPTVITGPADAMLASLSNLYRAKISLQLGHAIAAFHVEGPQLAPKTGRAAHILSVGSGRPTSTNLHDGKTRQKAIFDS